VLLLSAGWDESARSAREAIRWRATSHSSIDNRQHRHPRAAQEAEIADLLEELRRDDLIHYRGVLWLQ